MQAEEQEHVVLVDERCCLYVALDEPTKVCQNPFPIDLAYALDSDEAVFEKFVDALSRERMRVERNSSGEYSVIAVPPNHPRQRACHTFSQLLDHTAAWEFPLLFWSETLFPFSYQRCRYRADVAGGPRHPHGGSSLRATFVAEVCDTNPLSPNKLSDYRCDPYLQYFVVADIGHYIRGNSASLRSLTVTVYEKAPNGQSVVSYVDCLAPSNYGQEIFEFSLPKLFFPYPVPAGAQNATFDAFRLKTSVTTAIDDLV